jgi:predicted Zn-dependent protease
MTLVAIALALNSCAVNPLTGDDELMFYNVDQDFKVGAAVAPKLEEAMGGRIEDESLQKYIDRVGQKIARVCHHPEWDYNYVAVESEQVNALALPGGFIFITRGMLEKLNSEAELAGILGHETAHVVGRDSMNALSKQRGMAIASIAAAVADPSAGMGAFYAGQFLMLNYSREDETQADLSGLDYMVEAGYDPYGILNVMTVLEGLMERRPIEFFSTHPLPENRLHRLRQKIAIRYGTASGSKRVGQTDYQKHVLDYLASHPPPEEKDRKKQRGNQLTSEQEQMLQLALTHPTCCWGAHGTSP